MQPRGSRCLCLKFFAQLVCCQDRPMLCGKVISNRWSFPAAVSPSCKNLSVTVHLNYYVKEISRGFTFSSKFPRYYTLIGICLMHYAGRSLPSEPLGKPRLPIVIIMNKIRIHSANIYWASLFSVPAPSCIISSRSIPLGSLGTRLT